MYKSFFAGVALVAISGVAAAGPFTSPTPLSLGANTVALTTTDASFSFEALAGKTYKFSVDSLIGSNKTSFDVWLSKGLDKTYGGGNDLFTFGVGTQSLSDVSFVKHFNANKTVYFNIDSTKSANLGYSGVLSVTVVPEPATTALFLAGLGALGIVGRRRKTQG